MCFVVREFYWCCSASLFLYIYICVRFSCCYSYCFLVVPLCLCYDGLLCFFVFVCVWCECVIHFLFVVCYVLFFKKLVALVLVFCLFLFWCCSFFGLRLSLRVFVLCVFCCELVFKCVCVLDFLEFENSVLFCLSFCVD